MKTTFITIVIACAGCATSPDTADEQAVTEAYGVDYSFARPAPATTRAQGYSFVVRYLSHDSGKSIDAAEARATAGAGLDIVLNWEDTAQAALGGYGQGVADAQAAAAQAAAIGTPAGRPIYFSIDFDASAAQQGALDAYFDGVAAVLGREATGAYGGYSQLQRLFNAGKITWGWQTYAWSYGAWEPRAQLRQIENGIAGGSEDLDQAVATDFGQWGPNAPGPVLSLPTGFLGVTSTSDGGGYWLVKSDGGVFSFGDAPFFGSAANLGLARPPIAIAATDDAHGYYLAAQDGGVFTFGDAGFSGSMGGHALNAPVVGLARAAGGGYYLVAADGGVFTFGVAHFYGSMGGKHLNAPVVGIAAAPGGGYWLAAADGGVFTFGSAGFYGSAGNTALAAPVVGIAATPSGHGYWLVAADGGVFSFGDAAFFGSMGGHPLNAPVSGIAARPQGDGYWLVARDGGIFSFGAAGFFGRPQ
jgi:hypothetical protein